METYTAAVNADGEAVPSRHGHIAEYVDFFTEEMHVEYYGRHSDIKAEPFMSKVIGISPRFAAAD